jgi:SAM-dependent methyltransferase
MNQSEIKTAVSAYYTEKITTHGETSLGVDWNSTESQELRFKQLLSLFDLSQSFSINDLGCGYGALLPYIRNIQPNFSYTGYDIAPAMIQKAKSLFANMPNVQFICSDEMAMADYTIASGILNVKLEQPEALWKDYTLSVINNMVQASQKGIALNMLTSYSDPPFQKDYLYYADPNFYFDYAKTHFSRHVSLLHHYNLYEFTLVILKPSQES